MKSGRPQTTTKIVYLTLLLLILILPLHRHWIIYEWSESAVYYEFRAIIFYLSDAAVLFFFLAFILWNLKNPRRDLGIPAITIPLVLLPVLAALSALTAQEPGLAVMTAGRLLLLLLLYLALIRFRPRPQFTAVFLSLMLIGQAVVGLMQFLLQHDLGWQQLGEINLVAAPGQASIITVGSQSWLRSYGLTAHPNILGGILVTTLLLLFVCYLKANGHAKLLWLSVLGIGTAALLTTFSRAAWLGGLGGSLVLLIALVKSADHRQRYGRQLRFILIGGTLILALFTITQRDLLLARFQPQTGYTETRSINERLVLTDLSLEIIKQRPLLGIGAGHFSLAIVPPVSQMTGITAQPVHNVPLLTASELGIMGGLLWTWLMLAPLLIAIRQQRQQPLTLWAWALTAALTALAIIDLFDFYSWGWPQGRLCHWLLLALWTTAIATPFETANNAPL